jgi:hypothetical protein
MLNIKNMLNIHFILIILIYLFLLYSVFSNDLFIIRASIYLSIFMMLKWIFDYRQCTFGYWECKLRKVKREKGIINNFCEYYGNLIYSEYNYCYFVILIIIYIINLIKYFGKTYIYI